MHCTRLCSQRKQISNDRAGTITALRCNQFHTHRQMWPLFQYLYCLLLVSLSYYQLLRRCVADIAELVEHQKITHLSRQPGRCEYLVTNSICTSCRSVCSSLRNVFCFCSSRGLNCWVYSKVLKTTNIHTNRHAVYGAGGLMQYDVF